MSGALSFEKDFVTKEPGRPTKTRSFSRPWVSVDRRAQTFLEPEQLPGPRARITQGRAIGGRGVPEGGPG